MSWIIRSFFFLQWKVQQVAASCHQHPSRGNAGWIDALYSQKQHSHDIAENGIADGMQLSLNLRIW